ncbi:MAG: bifunctional nicotinamidase/pyrazinamidase [Verrucomicrobia bacterium]|nr:bifunctional nicotinamidase/pyrazinamidase [Verrucomicrobiota bacterium]
MKALILVDLQVDFLPGGALPVPQGEAVIPLANQLQGRFNLVAATLDWHPTNHVSFAVNHPGRKPGEVIVLKKVRQLLLPVHCVQKTRGAELAPGLMRNRINRVFRKGTDPDVDGYSGFFDADPRRTTGLSDYLHEKRVKEVWILGLGTEDCVRHTALDAVGLGLKTHVIEDACRGREASPTAVPEALAELENAGVVLVGSRAVL